MNPMLLQLLQRFGPRAAGMLQNGFGTRLGMINTPEPEGLVMPAPPTMASVSPPISGAQTSAPVSLERASGQPEHRASGVFPNERVAQGHNMFGPTPLQTAVATPSPLPSPPALSAQAMAQGPTAPPPAPMPAPRPPEAPQEMNFFQRNAAMMQDPNNPGSFIDPINAQRAQASGPDVINKFLQMFKDKA